MWNSPAFFCKTVLLGTVSGLLLSACGASTAVKPAQPDPYDRYYGQVSDADTGVFNDAIIVNPDAPRQYVVQPGDTLWRIANKFLNTPWYWPEVWDNNQGIANPHLIYPGDVLTLDYAGGNGDDKFGPRIRVDRNGEGEPIASLLPFLVWPRVLDQATIQAAPYVVSSQDAHALITQGETVYIRNLGNATPGQRCAIFHPNKALHDPRTGALMGYEVTYGGYSRLERADNPLATATVLESVREIRAGDRLLPRHEEVNSLVGTIHAPRFKVRGDVMELFDAEVISGNYMIAVINKGQRDRIEVGHTLGVYATGKTVFDPIQTRNGNFNAKLPVSTQLPPEKIANLVVYKVTDRVSYGLIMESTREVKTGYKIGNP